MTGVKMKHKADLREPVADKDIPILAKELANRPNSSLSELQILKIIRYTKAGLTMDEIARALNLNKSVVERIREEFAHPADLKGLKIFTENKADILNLFQHKFLMGITKKDIEKMAPTQRIMAFGILFDKERLLRGRPTQIAGIFSIVSELRRQQKEAGDRLKRLKTLAGID